MALEYQAPPVETVASQHQNRFAQLISEMQAIDKVELHLHLGGSWPLEYMQRIATPEQFSQLTQLIDRIAQGVSYHDVFTIFGLVAQIVNTDQKVEDGVVALCAQLAADRVTYVEIRTGIKDLGSGVTGYVEAVLRGIERARSAYPSLTVGLILSLRRDSSHAEATRVFDLADYYRSRGVVGIDISGDSTKGDAQSIFQALNERALCNFPITLHLGESPKETAEQQLKELQIFKPARIGHGVHLHPEARLWIRSRRLPLELCLTSAVHAGMIERAEDHPVLQMLRDGYPVVLCTDDPLIFGVSLSHECAYVAEQLGLSVDAIAKLQTITRNYAFLPVPVE